MGQNLYWRPKSNLRNDLSDALKRVLRDKRELSGAREHTYSQSEISYLRGLVDAGIDGAQELIDAIERHGEVIVWLE